MVSCQACGTSNTKKTRQLGITFHVFPKGERGQAWLHFANKGKTGTKGKAFLCSRHFSEDCFDKTSKHKIMLKFDAIPSIAILRNKYEREETTNQIGAFALNTTINRSGSLDIENRKEAIINDFTEAMKQRQLERKIKDLSARDTIQSKRIRALQSMVWKQKVRITSLRKLTIQLKKNTVGGRRT